MSFLTFLQKNRLSFITTGITTNTVQPLNDALPPPHYSYQPQHSHPETNCNTGTNNSSTSSVSSSSAAALSGSYNTHADMSSYHPHHHEHNHIPASSTAAAVLSTPAAQSRSVALDRTNDTVYTATTSVVKAIMVLSHGVERAVAAEYLDLVKNVGFELRSLLASVDHLSGVFPAQAHK